MTVGLLDTSIFIAQETRRSLDIAALPDESGVSIVTVAGFPDGVAGLTVIHV